MLVRPSDCQNDGVSRVAHSTRGAELTTNRKRGMTSMNRRYADNVEAAGRKRRVCPGQALDKMKLHLPATDRKMQVAGCRCQSLKQRMQG